MKYVEWIEKFRSELYKRAEENSGGWSKWTPNEAYREGYEAGADEALHLIVERGLEAHDARLLDEAAERAESWLIASCLYYMPEEMETRNEDIADLRAAVRGKE